MRRAVRQHMPAAVVRWAGRPREHPKRWLALLLDGEVEGVPFAEAYGRSVKAIRAFKGFWGQTRGAKRYRRALYDIVNARKQMRGAVRGALVDIMETLRQEAGLGRWNG